MEPVAGSHWRSWIGQPSQRGAEIDHPERSRPPSRMKAPFEVPTRSSVRLMTGPPVARGPIEHADDEPQGFSSTTSTGCQHSASQAVSNDGARISPEAGSLPEAAGEGSVPRLERIDDPAVRGDRVMVRGARDLRVRRLVVEDDGRRDAAGLADPLRDGVDRGAAVPDLVDDQDVMAEAGGGG